MRFVNSQLCVNDNELFTLLIIITAIIACHIFNHIFAVRKSFKKTTGFLPVIKTQLIILLTVFT